MRHYYSIFFLLFIGVLLSMKRESIDTPASARATAVLALASGDYDGMIAGSRARHNAGKKAWVPKGFKLMVDSLNHVSGDSVRAGELWLAYLDLNHALNLRIDTLIGSGDYTEAAEKQVDVLLLHTSGSRRAGSSARALASVQCRSGWARRNPRSWNFSSDDKNVFMSYDPVTTRTWHVRADSKTPVNDRSVSVEVCQFDGMPKAPATSNAVALFVRLSWQFPMARIEIHRDVDPRKGGEVARKGGHRGCPSSFSREEVDSFKERVENALQLWKELRTVPSVYYAQIPPP
jgi:hypothetical protein